MNRIQRAWKVWKALARAIGDVVARILLTIFYGLVFAPVAIGVRLLGDPLDLKGAQRLQWNRRTKFEESFDKVRKLF